MFDHSTHFNPVDLVCGVKNYKGKKFDLEKFIAPEQGFITHKSYKGKEITGTPGALEWSYGELDYGIRRGSPDNFHSGEDCF